MKKGTRVATEIQLFRDLFYQTTQPIGVADFNGRFLFCNPAFETLTGYSESELKKMTYEELTVEAWNKIVQPKISEVLNTGKSTRYEKEYRRKDGTIVPVELVVDLYRGPDGEQRYLFAFVTDITQRKKFEKERDLLLKREQEARAAAEASEEGNAFVLEASSILIASLDYESTLQRFAELVVPKLADLCIVWILADDDSVRPLALYHTDPEKRQLALDVMRRFPPRRDKPEGVIRVVTTGQPLLQPEIPDEALRQVAHSEEHYRYLKMADFHSYMGVPLRARDRIFGAISFFTTGHGRIYTPEDLAFAQEVAQRAAIVMDNARLVSGYKKSLEEKEVLLRELHHRVKNNLQVISSLLSLQSAGVQHPVLQAAFDESRSRIRTMALIHEKLYDTGDLARIDFGDYLRSLAEYLAESYDSVTDSKILFKIEAESYILNINQAVPLGLIANELISNSFKYAFPGREGEVLIELKGSGGGMAFLGVKDNGIGFPADLDVENTTTLGLKLVRLLVKQLDGSIEILREAPGAGMRIFFSRESF